MIMYVYQSKQPPHFLTSFLSLSFWFGGLFFIGDGLRDDAGIDNQILYLFVDLDVRSVFERRVDTMKVTA